MEIIRFFEWESTRQPSSLQSDAVLYFSMYIILNYGEKTGKICNYLVTFLLDFVWYIIHPFKNIIMEYITIKHFSPI